MFSMREVCNLTGLSYNTLKFWLKRKLLRPAIKVPRGSQYSFSAWQTCALAVLEAGIRDKRDVNSYVGRTGVLKVITAAAQYDDELLFAESEQDPQVAERVALEIARAQPSESDELSPAVMDNLAKVVRAIDARVRLQRERTTNRLR